MCLRLDIWHRDCFNGTVFKTLNQASEGECCAACTAAAGGECAGWNMPDGVNGSVCQLMKEPLVQWDDGQSLSKCKAAQVDHGGGGRDCWYDDPRYKTAFAQFCDKTQCSCPAIQTMAMGREQRAMCHDGRRRLQQPSPPPPPPPHGFWNCTAALEAVCPWQQFRNDPAGCASCATDNTNVLEAAGCDQAAIAAGCGGNYEQCFSVLDSLCSAEALAAPTSCEACAHSPANTKALEAANCTQFFIDYECNGHHRHENIWESYISELGCHLNGTWYSTREEGECKPGATPASDPNCFWKVKQEGRTVNASCVDGNVIAVVEKVRPDCFKACPQPTNQTSSCYLRCFFNTMVGNASAKLEAMPAADILRPFTNSFSSSDPATGGCPSV